MRELVRDLSLALREQVLPQLGSHAGRAHQKDADAAGGDVTFAIDAAAESFLEEFLAKRAPDVAFYSEDKGLVESAEPARAVLVVDPIDGTRPALAGLESCCVSVAAAPLCGEPTMGDVSVGCVVEIPSGQVFLAARGEGLVEGPGPNLSTNERIDRMFWTYGFRGRPARALTEVLAELLDASSVGGGTFDLGSAAFDMTRVVTGQMDAYVEPGPRMVDDVPGVREEFERVGGGAVLNNSPYDLAGAALVCREAGAIVTDAYGHGLEDRPLLGSGADYQMSVVCTANRMLHEYILREVERRRWPTGRADRFPAGMSADSRDVSLAVPARAGYLVLARLALAAVCRPTALEPSEAVERADFSSRRTVSVKDL
ncbi:MAG: inositol monophosphatase family protein [Thermoleophilaceae bacterium]